MKTEHIEKFAEEIYKIGFTHGAIEMKNKVLKGINRDMTLFSIKNQTTDVLRKIDTMRSPKPTEILKSINDALGEINSR